MILLFSLFSSVLGTANHYFEATLFEPALELYRQEGSRLKEIECLYHLGRKEEVIERLKGQNPHGEELYFLALAYQDLGQVDLSLSAKEAYLNEKETLPARAEAIKSRLALEKAEHYLLQKEWQLAKKALLEAPPTPEVLFTLIKASRQQGEAPEKIRAAQIKFLEQAPPSSRYYPEVAFELYPFQDYLLGKKEALKHLKSYVKEHPQAPQTISAWYLLGMDLKRDLKKSDGRWVHHKSLESAIEAFSKAETLFQTLEASLASGEKEYYLKLAKKSAQERALSLIEIAETSTGPKKEIYLKYAHHLLAEREEVEMRLLFIEVLMKERLYKEALNESSSLETLLGETPSYPLVQTLIKKGELLYLAKKGAEALSCFEKAEALAPEMALTEDEKLHLTLSKSLCHKELQNYDRSMLLLSEVVNSGVASSLRIKAMYLRALIYEELGKKELARRQLEAVLSKGGAWTEKAKEQWLKEYQNTYE